MTRARPPGHPIGVVGSTRVPFAKRDHIAGLGAKIQPQPNGCWAFDGRDLSEYVQTFSSANPQEPRGHRLVYSILRGPIPYGYFLHHVCENRGCVNPDHCRPMTPSDHSAHHAVLRRRTADAATQR